MIPIFFNMNYVHRHRLLNSIDPPQNVLYWYVSEFSEFTKHDVGWKNFIRVRVQVLVPGN
jgi:hypothetical protein